jgi:hypothetical protein
MSEEGVYFPLALVFLFIITDGLGEDGVSSKLAAYFTCEQFAG